MRNISDLIDHDISKLKQCLVDLQTIDSVIQKRKITWRDIRCIVIPLRLLISECALATCWNLVCDDPSEKLLINSKELPSELHLSNIILSCGNTKLGAFDNLERIGAWISVFGELSDNDAQKIQYQIDCEVKETKYQVHEYGKSIFLSIHGNPITRQTAIKYLANVSGVAHLRLDDPTRANGSVELKKDYDLMATYATKMWVNGKNILYLEAQNIAGDIITSPNVIALKEHLERQFSEDELHWIFI